MCLEIAPPPHVPEMLIGLSRSDLYAITPLPSKGQWPHSNQIHCCLTSVSHWAQPGNKRPLLQLPASKLTAFQKMKKLRSVCCQMLISPSPALATQSSFGIRLGEKGCLISFRHWQAHIRDRAHLPKRSKAGLSYFNIK